jgi:hypothetical protein
MACKLCLQEKKCVESHIIPESFFRLIKENGKPILILPDKIEKYPEKSHTGIYDENLVCEDCEKLFSPWDNYGHLFLVANFPKDKQFLDGDKVLAYVIENFDYHKLKLFFISMLWRASASSYKHFSHINTGPFEDTLKRMIVNNDPGDKNYFSVILTKFNNESIATAMLNPHREKLEGINYYSIYLGGFKVFIKVDNRESSELMKNFILAPNSPLYVVIRDFRRSSEFKVMKKIARIDDLRRKHSLKRII